jgi:branched-chain amino acid transport system permease protein
VAEWIQQIVSGLATGAIFASLALAIVLIYRATRVINFAQGEMATFTTFVVWSLVHHGVAFWLAFALTLAIAFAGGVAIERVVMRPLEHASVLTAIIVTIGLSLVLNGAVNWVWGAEQKRLPPRRPFPTDTYHVGGVAFSKQDIGVLVAVLIAVALLFALFQFTKVGLGLRAAALNPDASRLAGVRVGWMLALGWGLAASLGAVSGMLAAPPLQSFDQNFMQPILLYAFAGAVLGGIDSAAGAVVGSLFLGVFLNLVGTYVGWIGTDLRLPVALAVILAVLLVKPSGLFGRRAVRRV